MLNFGSKYFHRGLVFCVTQLSSLRKLKETSDEI